MKHRHWFGVARAVGNHNEEVVARCDRSSVAAVSGGRA